MNEDNSPVGAEDEQALFAVQREADLQAEAQTWDTTLVKAARAGDIPVIDVSNPESSPQRRADIIDQLGRACREVGFYSLIGHGIAREIFDDVFASAQRFHAQPLVAKMALAMDQPAKRGEPDRPQGAGYLPLHHRKLPRRARGNLNEAFIVKRDLDLSFEDNLWPSEVALPGFQASVRNYIHAVESLALSLLPLYAAALHMPADFFAPGFANPLLRLRLTHYPSVKESSTFGIAPHVDTTFFTLLAQDQPGLAVFSEQRQCWIAVPKVEGALVVNTGELLKQWSNDEFISVKHFANNMASGDGKHESRYSVPFFFNATSNYPMICIPSCCGPDRPAKYPTISYNQSQGVVQGE